MNKALRKYKSLGKDSIISLAITLFEGRNILKINFEEFDISAWTNSKSLIVRFRRMLKYVPIDSDFEYDISINIITKEIFPFDDSFRSKKCSFFEPTEKQKESINYIKKHTGLPINGFENFVYEKEDTYSISITNDYAFRKFELDKISGECYPAIEGSYIPPPERIITKKDPLIEIFE